MSKPSIGRIVHYTSFGSPGGEYRSECRAAIISDLTSQEGSVSLAVLNPAGIHFNISRYDESKTGGTWHWPECEE